MKNLTYLCLAFFMCATISAQTPSKNTIQRVRIDFKAPEGYVRHLLLAFTADNRATDGLDYGYDARNRDKLPDDLNWMIGSERFVIQGVGAYDASKKYPLGMFMANSGAIEITLTALEHFEHPIPVYIYDAWEGTYHLLNEERYQTTIESGIYDDRFYMTFSKQSPHYMLSDKEDALNEVSINYFGNSKTLQIDTQGTPLHLTLYTLHGQLISSHELHGTSETHALSMDYIQNQVVLAVLKSDQHTVYNRILIN